MAGRGLSFPTGRPRPLIELDGVSPGWIEVAVPSGVKARGVVTHRLRRDDRPRSMWVRGFRTTNVERTLLDLFSVLPQRGAELALEDALRRTLTTLNRLWDLCREVGIWGERDGNETSYAIASSNGWAGRCCTSRGTTSTCEAMT